MPSVARALVLLASLLLLGMYVTPIWRVRLTAPQYPEGLGMNIRLNTVEGATETDLRNINSLNHYIGMHAIEPDDIPELAVMPWIVGALVAGGVIVAARGRRRWLYGWLGAFLALGVAGLADFWRWEYDYGHNLDMAAAIIKIPDMSYQPPLIGTRQLLNFTAASWPAPGGYLAGLAFVAGIGALVLTIRAGRRARRTGAGTGAAVTAAPKPRGVV